MLNTQQRRPRVTGRTINAQQVFNPTGTNAAPARSSALGLANLPAERAVISVVLQQPDSFTLVSDRLEAGDFFGYTHGFIWHAFETLIDEGQVIDMLTVSKALDAMPTSPIKGDEALGELSRLYGAAPAARNLEVYVDQVRASATLIRLLDATVQIQGRLFESGADVAAVAAFGEQKILEATADRIGALDTSVQSALARYWQDLQARAAGQLVPGILTGWSTYDDRQTGLGGAHVGTVTVVAGMEGFGKTTWVLSLARNAAKAGLRVVIVSLEMREDEIMQLFVSMESWIWKGILQRGDLNAEQMQQFEDAVGRIAQWKLDIVDEFRASDNPLTPFALRRKLRLMMRSGQIDLLVIDGLWLMEATNASGERHRDVAQIMYELSDLAKGEIGQPMPIFITHQYSGEVAARNVKKPTIFHLAESAGVRRNAQVIIGLWRALDSDWMEAHVLKDRVLGHAGYMIPFKYEPQRSMYTEGR